MQPERIGQYQILEKLGSGGMGTVFLGHETESGRVAAIKILTASLAREPGFVERFNREIEALRKLQSPQIVTLFDSGVEGENYYYAMEYVPGETLMSLLRREKRIPWRRAVEIAIEVCQALKAAHNAGIIHRDLKPSNLLVMPDGGIKLTDFGVAQVFATNRLTVTGGIIGTAEYMSPEQAEGKRAGKQSDLYSLGAVMYAMVTGRTPFTGSTAVEVIQKHKFGVFDRPRLYVPELPHRLDDTICRLLEKDPAKRFPDALVLLRHLEQIVQREDYSPDAVTIAAGDAGVAADVTVPSTQDEARAEPMVSPGPATVMQALMRTELSQVLQGGVISAIFNNTLVLVTLLALLIAGGVWFLRPQELTPDEMWARAREALEQEPGPEWLRVRREYLEPLLARDAERWTDEVQPLLRKIEAYEADRALRSPRSAAVLGRTEPERLLHMARAYRQAGDLRRAERILNWLAVVLEGDEQQSRVAAAVDELRAEIRQQTSAPDNLVRWVQQALDRARQLDETGDRAGASEIRRGILDLYGDVPELKDLVRQAQEHLGAAASP